MKPDREEILKHTNINLYEHYRPSFVPYYMSQLEYDRRPIDPLDLQNYWHDGEWLWKGKIPKSYFQFDTYMNLTLEIDRYFSQNKWKRDISNYPDTNWDSAFSQDYDMENFIKYVWLLHEFTNNEGFTNAVSCHYNPRAGKIVIHPGGVRSLVIGLFGGEMVDSVFFNTGGFFQPFMDDMEPIDIEEMFAPGTGWHCVGIPDHGSVIPQPGKDMHIIPGHKKDWYWRIYNRITEGRLRIKTNMERNDTNISRYFYHWLDQWCVTEDPTVTIHFTNQPTMFDLQRSVYATFAEIDYKDTKLQVIQHAT